MFGLVILVVGLELVNGYWVIIDFGVVCDLVVLLVEGVVVYCVVLVC